MKKKAVIVDGHNFLFRGFYGVPSVVKRPDGTAINAVYGFFSLLRSIIKNINSDYLLVVFDSESSANHKKSLNPEYKKNRIIQDNSIFFQLSIIKKCLDILGIYWIENTKYEADDVIGTYSMLFSKKGVEVYICSNDHDFIQLISDNIFVVRGTSKNIDIYNHPRVINKFNILPTQYVDYLALVGDPSDNIKGIHGIGKKRAIDILSRNADIKSIFECFEFLNPLLKRLFYKREKEIIERKAFLTIKCDLKLSDKFNLKSFLFPKKELPEKMGEFLNKNWNKLIQI